MLMKRCLVFFIVLCSSFMAFGQVEIGLRVGANASRSIFDDDVYKEFQDSKYKLGFLGGIVAIFENNKNDKYALQTEFYYSKIGRHVVSSGNTFAENTATYDYLNLPVMFRMRFKYQYIDWYLLFGPQLNYWLGGKGVFDTYDGSRDVINSYSYKINFDEPIDDIEYINMASTNRLQLGLSVGIGLLYEINDADRVALDLRYYFGHTYMGERQGGEIPVLGLTDNFESTNQSLELTLIYTVDIFTKIRYMKNKYK